MNYTILAYAVLVMGVLGALFGLMLDIADKRFRIKEDEKFPMVRGCLSGANCGACGFAGCDAFAHAVIEGKVLPNGCPVGGKKAANAIGQAMSLWADETKEISKES